MAKGNSSEHINFEDILFGMVKESAKIHLRLEKDLKNIQGKAINIIKKAFAEAQAEVKEETEKTEQKKHI